MKTYNKKQIEIEARIAENPDASSDERHALDEIAEWFADEILEEARGKVVQELAHEVSE